VGPFRHRRRRPVSVASHGRDRPLPTRDTRRSGSFLQENGELEKSVSHSRFFYGLHTEEDDETRGIRDLQSSIPSSRAYLIEVAVISSQDDIEQLADRIERAYRRRYPAWNSIGLTPGVWDSAAARLLEAAVLEPAIPIDPELFVAVQIRSGIRLDPWAELTQTRSLRRYLRALDRIVGQLREELHKEVRRAEGRLLRGMTLDQLLASDASRISPLTLYILAHRAGRHDLSLRLRSEAGAQHRSCPLYRLASKSLLPAHAYPLDPGHDSARNDSELFAFSVN
jgi:hypothetical protein